MNKLEFEEIFNRTIYSVFLKKKKKKTIYSVIVFFFFLRNNIYIYIYIFFGRDFQPMPFASNYNFLSSGQDINKFLL